VLICLKKNDQTVYIPIIPPPLNLVYGAAFRNEITMEHDANARSGMQDMRLVDVSVNRCHHFEISIDS
jgi:hypothetical protein